MTTDDETTRVTTRATRKRLGSIDLEPSPILSTPKKTVVKKISDLAAISENGKPLESPLAKTPAVSTPRIRGRISISESVTDSPVNGLNDTPLAGLGLRKKLQPEVVTVTPGRRITRRTSAAEDLEVLPLPQRRVTRRSSATSEDAGPVASPLVRGKQRMSVAAVPHETTVVEETEETLADAETGKKSDSPAENTRSRLRALSQSPCNSGSDTKAAQVVKNLTENLGKEPVDTAATLEIAGKIAETDHVKTLTPSKSPSYTNNSTVQMGKLINLSMESENESVENVDPLDVETATAALDRSLVRLAETVQEKVQLPLADVSIMSSIQSPKVSNSGKVEMPLTPMPNVLNVRKGSIINSTPIAKPSVAAPSGVAKTPKVEKIAEISPIKLRANISLGVSLGETLCKTKEAASRSWSQSARGTTDMKIDKHGVTTMKKAEKSETPIKKFVIPKLSARKNVSSSEEEEEDKEDAEDKNKGTGFLNDECEEAPKGYESNDSMDSTDKADMEEHEIHDHGESVGSDDSAGAGDADFDEYERDSFLASDEDVDEDELLEGSGDDLSIDLSSPNKRNGRQLDVDDESMDSGPKSPKKSPKKGGRIIKNPIADSSDDDQELDDNELEVVKRFQDDEPTEDTATITVSSPRKEQSELTAVSEVTQKDSGKDNKSSSPRKTHIDDNTKPQENTTDDSEDDNEGEDNNDKEAMVTEELNKLGKTIQSVLNASRQSQNKSKIIEEENDEEVAENTKKTADKIATPKRKSLNASKEKINQSVLNTSTKSQNQSAVVEETEKPENEQSQTVLINDKKATPKRKSVGSTEKEGGAKKLDASVSKKSKNKTKIVEDEESEYEDAKTGDSGDDDDSGDGQDDESGNDESGEETSDDEFDDDSDDGDDSDEAPKKKKVKISKIDVKSNGNPLLIKDQRLHILLEKCNEFVGLKKDELEVEKSKTRTAREAKRQQRQQRKLEEAAKKQEQDAEEGRTLIKKKKKKKPKKKNPDLNSDDGEEKTDLPSIIKKKMEALEKHKQRNREKKAARKERMKKKASSNSIEKDPAPEGNGEKLDQKKVDKKAGKKNEKLLAQPPITSSEPKKTKPEVKSSVPEIAKSVIVKPVNVEESAKPLNENGPAAEEKKKKKRKILDIVDDVKKTLDEEKGAAKKLKKVQAIAQFEEQTPGKTPKKRLNILNESGEFSTANFDIDPVTPEAQLLKQNSGFKEASITPVPINFKVTSILPKQPIATTSKPRGNLRKKLADIQEVDRQLPPPKWKVKPTPSGEFMVTKAKTVTSGGFIPLSTEGSTTQFMVATLESEGTNGKKKRKFDAASAPTNAQKFKENALFGNRGATREPVKEMLRKMDKKKAHLTGRAGGAVKIF